MILLHKPELPELWFREKLLSDPETMSYNHAWGGTIPFPEEVWADWYDHWLVRHEDKRFYRYLRESGTGAFVGEIACHYDGDRGLWLADVIVDAGQRGKGYGREGLRLLCRAAAERGITVLYDDIAIDNPAISLFLREGFREEYRTDEIIMLRKELEKPEREEEAP
jgi:RimJ/RimL family protein N-acetyltransferase